MIVPTESLIIDIVSDRKERLAWFRTLMAIRLAEEGPEHDPDTS